MLFNSYEFVLLFLPSVLGLYYLGIVWSKPVFSRLVLLFGSLFFYAYWDVRYLPLLLASIAVNYGVGRRILASCSPKVSKAWLVGGVVVNLLTLFYFKYISFALAVLEQTIGLKIAISTVPLPLGISFFTFTQIAFLVDAYRRQAEELRPASYGLFVTVFPHLIAGPILHHRDIMNQFNDEEIYRWNADNVVRGILYFTIGLAKKVLIADSLAPLVKAVFDAQEFQPGMWDAWGAAVAYTLQLYFDFSGYSDMAVGLGLMFNIQLPINFDSPYKAKSIIDFWRRWHMTLSAFLRDYLYIPLGGSRHGEGFKLLNIFLTMLLGGLWHGAGWTFLLWGILQGVYLVINHWARNRFSFPSALAWPLTLVAVIVGWVLFRASDLDRAVVMFQGMMGIHGLVLPIKLGVILSSWMHTEIFSAFTGSTVVELRETLWIGILLLLVLFMPNSNSIVRCCPVGRTSGLAAGLLLTCCVLNFDSVTEFLYFQF